MVRDIHYRLARLEAKRNIGAPKFEVWVDAGDGYMRHKDGMTMTRDGFDVAFPNTRRFTLDIFENSDRH
jgi:hypothetical protein